MKEDQKKRIESHLLHSSRFLWGLAPEIKKEPGQSQQNAVYAWLWGKGFEFTRSNYAEVTIQLLRHPGIEELLQKLIVPLTKAQYPKTTLDKLQEYWAKGEPPGIDEIEKLDVKQRGDKKEDIILRWRPFLEIGYLPKGKDEPRSKYYVEKWGEYAFPYLMEIEPWIKELEEKNK
jgi:hypothetical protein